MNNVKDFKSFMDQEKRNTRTILIQRIFEYEQFVGILSKKVVKNPFYYNDRFNELYDMNFYHLEELEQKMHEHVYRYGELILK
jgi:hypothetical protein